MNSGCILYMYRTKVRCCSNLYPDNNHLLFSEVQINYIRCTTRIDFFVLPDDRNGNSLLAERWWLNMAIICPFTRQCVYFGLKVRVVNQKSESGCVVYTTVYHHQLISWNIKCMYTNPSSSWCFLFCVLKIPAYKMSWRFQYRFLRPITESLPWPSMQCFLPHKNLHTPSSAAVAEVSNAVCWIWRCPSSMVFI